MLTSREATPWTAGEAPDALNGGIGRTRAIGLWQAPVWSRSARRSDNDQLDTRQRRGNDTGNCGSTRHGRDRAGVDRDDPVRGSGRVRRCA